MNGPSVTMYKHKWCLLLSFRLSKLNYTRDLNNMRFFLAYKIIENNTVT